MSEQLPKITQEIFNDIRGAIKSEVDRFFKINIKIALKAYNEDSVQIHNPVCVFLKRAKDNAHKLFTYEIVDMSDLLKTFDNKLNISEVFRAIKTMCKDTNIPAVCFISPCKMKKMDTQGVDRQYIKDNLDSLLNDPDLMEVLQIRCESVILECNQLLLYQIKSDRHNPELKKLELLDIGMNHGPFENLDEAVNYNIEHDCKPMFIEYAFEDIVKVNN